MEAAFSFIFGLISKWYIWLPVVGILAYFTWQNNRKAAALRDMEHTLLILEIPRTNDKKELAAEQMFASLHGILRSKSELRREGGLQEHISFEFAAIKKQIRFYVWVPTHLQNFVEGQIYAQYPTVQIHEADEDYADRDIEQEVVYGGELSLADNEALPIKTFQSFEVDPLAAITATLAKLDDEGEEMWIQVMARPIPDTWHRRSAAWVDRVKNGGIGSDVLGSVGSYALQVLTALFRPPESSESKKDLSEREKTRVSEAETKSTKLGYQVKIRLVYLGNNQNTAKLRMQAIVGTFKQFNSTNLNGFNIKNAKYGREVLSHARARFFIDRGFILNIEELASVYHLPHTNVETPSIVWANSKTAEPPSKLPVITGDAAYDAQISAFGLTNFRGYRQQFGMRRGDRGRHVYIIGQTGTGKSGMLELLTLSDVYHNEGYAIIDPHGDFAVDNLRFVPANRIQDVVYFNPSDTGHPIGFNPMEVHDPAMKNNVSSEIIGVLKRMFGDSWGPRLEYILRYTILALLDYPNATMLDITRMLTDKNFRKDVLSYCEDAVVLNFWQVEFASWQDRFANEAVAPVLNKVGAFVANPIIRNIIGQSESTFNIRKIMDEGKILVVNLSKGLIGEDNASILGSFIVTQIQLAAMSRSDIERVEDRRPFYLYVDEFQNFATDSFATILSEARKYGLNLTVANQYVAQMEDVVRDAVFGNVGTVISFRVSADDAPDLAKPLAPYFEPEDLLAMNNRHFVTSMVIDGEKTPAFTGTTLTLPPVQADLLQDIIQHTRQVNARPRAEVEAEIHNLMYRKTEQTKQQQPKQSQTQQKQWPPDSGAKRAQPQQQTPNTQQQQQSQQQPQQQPANANQQPAQQSTEQQPAGKRKRSRSRSRSRNKNRAGDENQQTTVPPRESAPATEKPKIEEQEIKLR